MIRLHNVSLRRGSRALFEGAELRLGPRERLGVTGANGCGKSSLFSLILGQLHADAGEVDIPAATVLAHVAQETPALDRSALDYVIDGDRELRAYEGELLLAEADGDGHRQASLHAAIEAIDGYRARARAGRLLHGLGFADAELERPVKHFSGGWRMRLNLAQALMCRSDLLLLDEPTNHLDLDTVLWLEDWLRAYPGSLMLISHDRDFLDNVINRVAHIEQGRLNLYTGNYSAFERTRAERLAQQQSAFEKQQREIAHIHRFVERFRAKATKARQAQSRLKTLARMELIAPAHVDSPFHFQFRDAQSNPHPLLQLEQVRLGYDDTPILDGVGLTLAPGDRVALLGPNGAGKSTLIKAIAGELAPRSGQRRTADTLKIGYFAQHQLDQLDPKASPLQHLLRLDAQAREQDLRDFLGGFGFGSEQAGAPVAPLSGGEKARLVLALLTYERPNLLLLDEPTNHLDLEMRLALSIALQEYSGGLVLVSHDRHLLRSVADRCLLVHDHGVREFDGDLDDYAAWLKQVAADNDEQTPDKPVASDRKQARRDAAEARARLQPLKRELAKVEKRLHAQQQEQAELETRLTDTELYQSERKQELQDLLKRKGALDAELEQSENQWLELSEELEAARLDT